MTHFNHEWDTTKTPAVPTSVGDRYYAQDLNDDFNYLKHLPYEVFLQGRSRGVMISPNDTWEDDTNSLTLSGGFGTVLQDCVELDPNEDFVIPPKTHSSPRYERVPFVNTTLILPNDDTTHYIVATPTKRSLLQRIKSLFTEQYASRIRYDGVITIQDTAPTAEQILVGLCHNKEYCLLIDADLNQCKDDIILKKWFGQNKITKGFITILQSYYNTTVDSVETKIFIDTISSGGGVYGIDFNNCYIFINTVSGGYGIGGGTFNNCYIFINTVSGGRGISGGGTFNNCNISINTVSGGDGIINSTFNNCTISIDTVNSGGDGISSGTFNSCNISINIVNGDDSVARGVGGGTLNNCYIYIDAIIGDVGIGIYGKLNNCNISINTASGSRGINDSNCNNCNISITTVTNNSYGINSGIFNNCSISINKTNGVYGIGSGIFNNCTIFITTVSGGYGIYNNTGVKMYLTYIKCSAITDLSGTGGKLNVLNNTVLHTS